MSSAHQSIELADVLKAHGNAIESLGNEVIGGDKQKVAGALAGLITSVATGSPLLGTWATAAVQKAFVPPATQRLLAEAKKYDKELGREAFISRLRDEVEMLLGQAILQSVRAQHNVKEEVLDALGGLQREFEEFRSEFARALEQQPNENVHVEQLLVEGGLGVRVSSGARSRMHVKVARVTSGIGFELN